MSDVKILLADETVHSAENSSFSLKRVKTFEGAAEAVVYSSRVDTATLSELIIRFESWMDLRGRRNLPTARSNVRVTPADVVNFYAQKFVKLAGNDFSGKFAGESDGVQFWNLFGDVLHLAGNRNNLRQILDRARYREEFIAIEYEDSAGLFSVREMKVVDSSLNFFRGLTEGGFRSFRYDRVRRINFSAQERNSEKLMKPMWVFRFSFDSKLKRLDFSEEQRFQTPVRHSPEIHSTDSFSKERRENLPDLNLLSESLQAIKRELGILK